jgi:hypothetical protein
VRHQALHADVVFALRAWREMSQGLGWYRPEGPVWPSEVGDSAGHWRKGGVVLPPRIVRRLVVSAGLPNPERWVTHSTRHSTVTLEAVAGGSDLRSVAGRVGMTIDMLETYLHQAGRGLASSRLPSLTGAQPTPTAGPSTVVVLAPKALPNWQTTATAKAIAENPKPLVSSNNLNDIAAAWVAGGEAEQPRPKAVTVALRRTYSGAYNHELSRLQKDAERAGKPIAANARDCAAVKGKLAKRAKLAAWTRAVELARKNASRPVSRHVPTDD